MSESRHLSRQDGAIALPEGWVQDAEWWGNPALGLLSFHKKMRTEAYSRRVPVYVYGGGNPPYDRWGNFCVHAGANSELSYSGFIPESKSAEDVMNGVDKQFEHINTR